MKSFKSQFVSSLLALQAIALVLPSTEAFAIFSGKNKAAKAAYRAKGYSKKDARKAARYDRKIARHESKGHTGKRYEKLKAKQAALGGGK